MTPRRMHRVMLQLRQAVQCGDGSALPDAELLRSFIDDRNEAAFAALVRRHAAMVLGVCKRVTGDEHDADDAFQAAFCVLLRKAGSIRRRAVLSSWLYGVAYRTALAARARRARTRRREHQVVVMPQPLTAPPEPTQDWQPLLDAALERLSESYRTPIILCDLQGKSRKEAAQLLGLAEGTLSSRLARGRRLLAARLKRQGLALSGGALAAFVSQQAAQAHVPNVLVQVVTQAGAQVLAGQASAAVAFSSQVLALSEIVMKAILLGKIKTLTVTLMACATLTLAGYWALGGQLVVPPAVDDGPAAANRSAELPLASYVQTDDNQPQYRIETALQLPDAVPKSIADGPAVTVPLGQRASVKFEVLVKPAGEEKTRPASVHWHVEIVRERGQDALINITVERKDRRANGTVRGQSLEFEDFVPLNVWREINDPALGGMTFKFLVSRPKLAAPPPVPLTQTFQHRMTMPRDANLAGAWRGSGWGDVHLKRVGADEFAGTYSDTYSKEPGKITVRWSSVARQFEGAWSEGTRRFGKISLRLSDDTAALHGAYSADPKCDYQPGIPSLADLTLRRVRGDVADRDGDDWPNILIDGAKPRATPQFNPTASAPNAAPQLQIISLQHAKAADFVAVVQKLYPDNKNLRLTAVDAGRVLLHAEKADADVIVALAAKLDVPDPGPSPTEAAFSPDRGRLAVANGNNVQIYDAATGKLLSQSVGASPVRSIAFSPDGKLLASGTARGTVQILDAATGKVIREVKNAQPILRLEFAVDANTKVTILVVRTAAPEVCVWDPATGQLLRTEKAKEEKK